MSTPIYFDYAATTPVDHRVLDVMLPFFSASFGNPSSVHRYGQQAEAAIDAARETVASVLHCRPDEIIFTSCGSESDNLALRGAALAMREKTSATWILTSQAEHHAVSKTAGQLGKYYGFQVEWLEVDQQGMVTAQAVEKAICDQTALVSVMYANNEIGTINPVAEIAGVCRRHGVLFHTDAVLAAAYLPVDVNTLGVDLMSLGGHKFYGPKGVGALYIRKGTPIWPLLDGGLQENKRRAGSENQIGIVGLGAAAEAALQEMPANLPRIKALRDRLQQGISERIPEIKINGHLQQCLPHLFSVSVTYIEGESLMMLLEDEGIIVNTRSACASGSLRASHVLIGTGLDHALAQGTLVFTLGRATTEAEIDRVLTVMPRIVQTLRDMSPLYKKEHTA